jgi:hypothetical protein
MTTGVSLAHLAQRSSRSPGGTTCRDADAAVAYDAAMALAHYVTVHAHADSDDEPLRAAIARAVPHARVLRPGDGRVNVKLQDGDGELAKLKTAAAPFSPIGFTVATADPDTAQRQLYLSDETVGIRAGCLCALAPSADRRAIEAHLDREYDQRFPAWAHRIADEHLSVAVVVYGLTAFHAENIADGLRAGIEDYLRGHDWLAELDPQYAADWSQGLDGSTSDELTRAVATGTGAVAADVRLAAWL